MAPPTQANSLPVSLVSPLSCRFPTQTSTLYFHRNSLEALCSYLSILVINLLSICSGRLSRSLVLLTFDLLSKTMINISSPSHHLLAQPCYWLVGRSVGWLVILLPESIGGSNKRRYRYKANVRARQLLS